MVHKHDKLQSYRQIFPRRVGWGMAGVKLLLLLLLLGVGVPVGAPTGGLEAPG